MIRRHRRWLLLPTVLLMALPMLAMLAPLGELSRTQQEDRVLASPPALFGEGVRLTTFPRRMDAFLQDHFGFRRILVLANGLIRDRLGNGDDQVFVGQRNHLYLREAATLQQSSGALGKGRWSWLLRTADMLADMQAALRGDGATLLVASPPNSSTLEQADLPPWARIQTRPTEYDHFLALLKQRDIRTVDLRPVLAAAARGPKIYYRHDTHWTPYGALAAFNAIADASGHPNWQVPLSDVTATSEPRVGGDLARLLGIADMVSESGQKVSGLPRGADRQILQGGAFQAFAETMPHPGPTIMVVGDSFTDSYFLDPLRVHAGRIVWAHAALCAFNWEWVRRYHPSEVWYMPVERLIPCPPGHRPIGLPRPERAPSSLSAAIASERHPLPPPTGVGLRP
jgi:alginate O-acetyltransferase complex protein AlgJ